MSATIKKALVAGRDAAITAAASVVGVTIVIGLALAVATATTRA